MSLRTNAVLVAASAASVVGALVAPPAAAADSRAPTPVSNLRVSNVTFTTATLSWDRASDDSGWVWYVIEVRGSQILQRFGSVDTTKSVSALAQGAAYTATVWTRDGANNESEPVSIRFSTPLDTQPPAAPANLHAVQQDSQFTAIAWDAAADNSSGLTYSLWSGSNQLTGTGGLDLEVFDLEYIQCVVDPGSVHTLTVQARDAAGNVSQLSNTITVQFP